MDPTSPTPRVTLGIATYNRDTYLAAAIDSGLAQDLPDADLEVLVVLDGSTNPAIDEVLSRYAQEPRLRVVRRDRNRGIAAAYNSFVEHGRGELIAMVGDDDLCLPGRLRRQVEIFDRFPDTGVVHGDAIVIDAQGAQTGLWNSRDFTPGALVQSFFRSHNHLVDPTRMVHRRVYETVGGYDDRYPLANDFDFWLRAAPRFRFRHCPGGPLTAVRRHGENTSDEGARAQELADVEAVLAAALERHDLRELVPELDWAVLDPHDAECQALERLATALEKRLLPVPGLAAELRARAARACQAARTSQAAPTFQAATAAAPQPRPTTRPERSARRLMITSFGFNDAGGGTTVPRLAAKELVRRGWDVTVFHAAVRPTGSGIPYEIRTWTEDGVRLIGVHNRPHGLFDLGNPWRELDDPPIAEAFAAALDRTSPDLVHFHNLHNLGASLIDHALARGLPAYFTTHNYWLICPRAYLMDGVGSICAGPGDGSACAGCVGSSDTGGHARRLAEIRARSERGLTAILAVSDAVRHTLIAAGYSPELVDVVHQAMPHEQEIWEQVGRDRTRGRRHRQLTVAFLGSAYPHKGPQLLIEAAQRTQAEIKVRILGEVPDRFAAQLTELDRRGVVELNGAFAPSEIGGLLSDVDAAALPSLWWDCAPLAAAECRAARLPLIVPRLGGLAEVIEHGIDGLTFTPLDPDDLAAQLDRLALEPGLLERMQAAIEPPRAFAGYVDELEAYYGGERPGRPAPAAPKAPTAPAAPKAPTAPAPPKAPTAPAPPKAPTEPAVRWQGDHGLPTSLSIVNDEVTRRLPATIQRIAKDGAPADPPLPHAAAVEVRHQWPPDLTTARAGRLAVILPWEFGAVPEAWLGAIDANVDELWVPSEHVRRMYLDGGVAADRVTVIPNGVDLERFTPDGPKHALPPTGTRFLFVGGLIWRKGPDVLLDAWRAAFPGRDDVTLLVKDFGAGGVYRGADRGPIREYAQSNALPRIQLIDQELTADELAGFYRACDVLVHPYRGEGFAMPVLEAMACGLPVIATAGGPTDEFCPPAAGWRIRSRRVHFPEDRIDALVTAGRPWVLEPDADHLVELLRAAADTVASERLAMGMAARSAAQRLSWDAVAARYADRIDALIDRRPRLAGDPSPEPFPLTESVSLRVLATPAWRAEDQLPTLLRAWAVNTTRCTSACLYLLADPAADGSPEELEARVLAAAAHTGADLDACADINVLMEPPQAERDRRLHAAVDVYVPLHGGCAGHERLARRADSAILAPAGAALSERLTSAPIAVPTL
jgi:glycosyltransferase involved in cell wall biosynthesis